MTAKLASPESRVRPDPLARTASTDAMVATVVMAWTARTDCRDATGWTGVTVLPGSPGYAARAECPEPTCSDLSSHGTLVSASRAW